MSEPQKEEDLVVRRRSSSGEKWVREQIKSHKARFAGKIAAVERLRGIAMLQRKRELDASEKQTKAAAEIARRMDTWVNSAKSLKEHISARKSAVAAFGGFLHTPFAEQETGKIKEVNHSDGVWKSVAQQTGASVGKDLAEKIEAHLKEMEITAKRINATMKKVMIDMENKKNALKELWSVYYENLMLYLRAMEAGSSAQHDPFISGKKYDAALIQFRTQQKLFSEEMEKILNEVKLVDEKRISTLQNIFLEYLVSEHEAFQILLKVRLFICF
jgi:hypothetical protein